MNMSYISRTSQFLDLFVPPDGYKTTFLEATTFSMHLNFVALLPALMAAGEGGGIENGKLNSSIRRWMKLKYFLTMEEHYRILYDGKGKISADPSVSMEKAMVRRCTNLLSRRCKAVTNTNGYFHPKIMLFQFEEKENKENIRFRLFISSRNLTFANYFETGIWIELDEFYAEKAISEEQKKAKEQLSSLSELFTEHWVEPTKNWVQPTKNGIDWEKFKTANLSKAKDQNGDQYQNLSIHLSNFYNDIKTDASSAQELRILSMKPTEFWGIGGVSPTKPVTKYIANEKDVYDNSNPVPPLPPVIHPNHMAFLEELDEFNNSKNPPVSKAVHGKMYVIYPEKTENPIVTWIGSGNCSNNALKSRNNTEIMVRVESQWTDVTQPYPPAFLGSSFFGDYHLSDNPSPNTEEIDDEETASISLTMEYVSYENNVLKISVENVNVSTIFIRPLGSSERIELKSEQEQKLEFNLKKSKFTPIFMVSDGNDKEYMFTLTLTEEQWKETGIDRSTKHLPPPPIERISELFEPFPDVITSEDIRNHEPYQLLGLYQDLPKENYSVYMALLKEDIQEQLLSFAQFFPPLSQNKKETYEDYIARAKSHSKNLATYSLLLEEYFQQETPAEWDLFSQKEPDEYHEALVVAESARKLYASLLELEILVDSIHPKKGE